MSNVGVEFNLGILRLRDKWLGCPAFHLLFDLVFDVVVSFASGEGRELQFLLTLYVTVTLTFNCSCDMHSLTAKETRLKLFREHQKSTVGFESHLFGQKLSHHFDYKLFIAKH